MKKQILTLIFALVFCFGYSQIDLRLDGTVDIPNTPTVVAMGATDSVIVSTTDAKLRRISFGDFIDGLGGGTATSHAALTGLGADDHTQYHTDARAQSWLTALYPDLDIDGSGTSITNGTNTTVSGDGSIGSPYQIGLTGVVLTTGTQTVGGEKIFSKLINTAEGFRFGSLEPASSGTNGFEWLMRKEGSNGLVFSYESGATTNTFPNLYSLNTTGVPTSAIDLTDKAYVDSQLATAGTDDQTLAEVLESGNVAGNDIVMDNASSIQFQDLTGSSLARYDFSAQGVGFRISPQTRPTTGDLFVNRDLFAFDNTDLRWEIDSSPILTAANASPNGITDDQTAAEVSYDDTASGAGVTNAQDAFDNIYGVLDNTAIGETMLNASRSAIDSDRFGIIANYTSSDYIYTIDDGDFSIGDRLVFENFSTGNIEIAYAGSVTGDVAETVNNTGFVVLKKTGIDTWIIYDAEATVTQAEYTDLPAGLQSNARYKFYFTD